MFWLQIMTSFTRDDEEGKTSFFSENQEKYENQKWCVATINNQKWCVATIKKGNVSRRESKKQVSDSSTG